MLEVSTCSSISDSVGLDLSLALESGEWSTVRDILCSAADVL